MTRLLPATRFPSHRRSLAAAFLLVVTVVWLPNSTFAQQAPAPGSAAALSQQGAIQFERGQYKEAAASYEALLKGFPNSELALDAQFRLAYADFLLGLYDPAVQVLRKLMTQPALAPESMEQAMLLLPQVLAQKAAALKADDPTRQAAFEAAIKEYDAFIAKFPKSTSLESAYYGRAVCAYQIARYDAAARDLRQNLASFGRSETILDSEFLLAITVATQANLANAKADKKPADTAAAIKGYQEAEKLLGDIIGKRTDLALANDAQFQLGETVLAHAAAVPIAEQPALFRNALAAYRAVEPKEGMIAVQTARIQTLLAQRGAEAAKAANANKALLKQFNDRILSEQGKLESLRKKDDPVLTARIKEGAVFYSLQKYDETRVLMNGLLPVATRPEDEKLALYYITETYASQGLIDKAVAAYEKFQAKYKGDPIAENLPLFIASLFQNGDKADPAKAQKYLEEFSQLYPKSPLRETVLLQSASTQGAQGKYDEALKLVDQFLASKPKRELQAAGELTRAGFLAGKRDFNGALAGFKKVRDTYKGLPEAEEAAFRVGVVAFQKKDFPGAITELKSFIGAFPQSKELPSAILTLAQAQQGSGAKDQALATLTDLAAKFPDSEQASNGYFLRANIYLSDKKYDETAKVLTEFVEKHPDSEQAFSAYNTIASIQTQQNKYDEAAASYEKFISKEPPNSPEVAEALSKVAALWLRAAKGMGSFIVLGAPQKEVWTKDLENSIASSERQLQGFPEAPSTALGLQNLLECQKLLVGAKVKTEEQVVQYFQGLSDKYRDNPGARSRILFRLASLTAEKDPAKALADMKAAYDPKVVYSPADLELYSRGLLARDPAGAEAVFDKAVQDYPVPAGMTPAQAPADVQEAQALALFGRAKLAEAKGDKAGAGKLYDELIKTYPRSPKVSEAKLGVAESLVSNNKPDEAIPMLADVLKLPTTPIPARARAMFLMGKIQEGKGQEGAMDSYLKVAVFYPVSAEAPEGLWKGGQLLEKQAANLSETPAKPGGPTKSGQLARARKAYQDLAAKYPTSEWAAQAKARVAALPAPAK